MRCPRSEPQAFRRGISPCACGARCRCRPLRPTRPRACSLRHRRRRAALWASTHPATLGAGVDRSWICAAQFELAVAHFDDPTGGLERGGGGIRRGVKALLVACDAVQESTAALRIEFRKDVIEQKDRCLTGRGAQERVFGGLEGEDGGAL